MQRDVAFGADPLLQAARFIEAIDRRDHRFALVIQQQRTVHQPDRARAALALAPTLGGADHLAPVEIDVETAIAKCTVDFAQGRNATQFIQQLTDRIAEPAIGGFDAVLVALATRWRVDQRDVDG
ncbi:hypothetical protein D3C84_993080 [compost metagenome]